MDNLSVITETSDLVELCKKITKESSIVGIDTEFIRKTTYYPILCLIQIAFYNNKKVLQTAIIDALSTDLTSFFSILENKRIKKIIHSCSQDIDALMCIKRVKINNLEDTQLMGEFCGNGLLSYSNSINEHLDVIFTKSKQTQTSNWKKRPLTKKQLQYAKNDVVYLMDLYKFFYEKLVENGNLKFYKNELEHLLLEKEIDYIINNAWKKLKFHLHKKPISEIYIVKEIAKWREKQAIEQNVIRNTIMDDKVLINIAIEKPKNAKQLKDILNISGQKLNISKDQKNELMEIINNAVNIVSQYPKQDIFYNQNRNFPHKDIFKKIFSKVKQIAEERQILVSKTLAQQDIVSLIMGYEAKKVILYGWKWTMFGKEINCILNSKKYK